MMSKKYKILLSKILTFTEASYLHAFHKNRFLMLFKMQNLPGCFQNSEATPCLSRLNQLTEITWTALKNHLDTLIQMLPEAMFTY